MTPPKKGSDSPFEHFFCEAFPNTTLKSSTNTNINNSAKTSLELAKIYSVRLIIPY